MTAPVERYRPDLPRPRNGSVLTAGSAFTASPAIGLTFDDVASIISQELDQSATIDDLELALSYYLGNPNGKEVAGRSQVTSTDVADCIEWIMPQVMEAFTQNNEVVVFDPTQPGDERQAEMETSFTYDVLMKHNPGFIILHQFIKDALMQRNGVLKCYYEHCSRVWTDDFTGLTEADLAVLLSAPTADVVSAEQADDGSYSLRVRFTSNKGKIAIDPVPPEQFRYNSDHSSIDVSTARFTAHLVQKTESELIEYGLDADLVRSLPDSNAVPGTTYRFSEQGEHALFTTPTDDTSTRLIDIGECYMQLDIDGDGVSELCKVLVVMDGERAVNQVLEVQEIECMPWITTTAILMSHKFQGRSIYDRIKEIQDQKTSLWRNSLDNIYFQNNQRLIVLRGQVEQDDLVVSRPGGIIRANTLNAVAPLMTPPLGQDAANMMAYLDQVRGGRAGVTPDGAAKGLDIGDRVGSEGVDRMFNAKEALVGLIIRVIAETGIKPLCCMIRDLASKHMDTMVDYNFRGEWVKVRPTDWPERSSTTVRVGTGTGNVTQKTGALLKVMDIQSQLAALPGQALVNESKAFAALNEFCKLSGLNGASQFFLDPASQEGQQQKQAAAQSQQQTQQQAIAMQMEQLKAEQTLAQAEVMKAQAAAENNKLKAQIEALKLELTRAKDQASAAKESASMQFMYDKLETDASLKLLELDKAADEFSKTMAQTEAAIDDAGTE